MEFSYNLFSRSDQFMQDFNESQIKFEGNSLLIFFSRSDQFIKDYSCKFEEDFNILVNFFFSHNFFKGISYV